MLYGNYLLASIIDNENGAREFVKIDPDRELFRGPELEVYDFVRSHLQKHGSVPVRETIKKHLPAVSLPTEIPEPTSYYHERLQSRHQYLEIKQAVQDAAQLLNSDQSDQAEETLFDSLMKLRRVEYHRRVVDYAQEGAGIIKDHLTAVRKGYDIGIPFGWPYLDARTNGMLAGDFMSIIGRPGKGKTYMMLYVMLHGWKHGFSPMFVSMEMNPLMITQRIAALDTHTSATQIKNAEVSGKKMQGMLTTLVENKNRPPLWVIDGGLSATPDDILLHALEKKPDIVFVDGAYLLRARNSHRLSRWERISDNAEALKRDLAEGLQIPIVCSYQFNRDAAKVKKDQAVGLEGIAGADAIGQLSSLVLGMFEDTSAGNVEQMQRRKIEILKGRHGEAGEFWTNWIFDAPEASLWMDFSEVVEETLDDLSFM